MDIEWISMLLEGLLRRRKSCGLVFAILLISFAGALAFPISMESILKTNEALRLHYYSSWYFALLSGQPEDAEWLQQQDWIETVGNANCYGVISAGSEQIGFGTLDEPLIESAGLRLSQGRWPENADEIVMEADSLSALGYDYTLGQPVTVQIRVDCGESSVPVQRTFTLCGVLEEYSSLWQLSQNSDGRRLVSAVTTPETAEKVLSQAQSEGVAATPQYFLWVEPSFREEGRTELLLWMFHSRTGVNTKDLSPCENKAAYPDQAGNPQRQSGLYTGLIAAVAFAALLCIFVTWLPAESRRFAVLRGIGMSRGQLAGMVLTETLFLVSPAILMGIALGSGIAWLTIRLLIYYGQMQVQVSIPWTTLILLVLLWTLVLAAAQFLLMWAALHTSLNGRMRLAQTRQRQIRRARSGLVLVLLLVFSVSSFFLGMNLPIQIQTFSRWKNTCHYAIGGTEEMPLTLELEAQLEQLAGAAYSLCTSEIKVGLSFPGKEEITPYLEVLKPNDWWEKMYDLGEDREAFWNGDLALLYFPEEDIARQSADWIVQETGEIQTNNWLLPEGAVTLRAYGEDGALLAESRADVRIRSQIKQPSAILGYGIYSNFPYTVVCSDAYFEKFLEQLPPGAEWNGFRGGAEYRHQQMEIRLQPYAALESTDRVMAEFCEENNLTFWNRREEVEANEQLELQKLLLLAFPWTSAALFALLCLYAQFALEAEQEKQSSLILRAIGMSRWQQRRKTFVKGAFRGGLALAAGGTLYLVYESAALLERIQVQQLGVEMQFGEALILQFQRLFETGSTAALAVGCCLLIPLALTCLAERNLGKTV